jgi:arginyl-tRNA synthetase
VKIAEPAERALALALLGFDGSIQAMLSSYEPHRLCTYLFDLSTTFTTFYETCPVLRAPDDGTRQSRLALCDLTARVISQGLDLLGIGAPEQM